jgi:hypothetical protein
VGGNFGVGALASQDRAARSDTAVSARALAVGLNLEVVEDWLRSAQDRGLVTEKTAGLWELTVPYRYYVKFSEGLERIDIGLPARAGIREGPLARVVGLLRRTR